MTIFYATLQENFLGYATIFACIGLGFLFLRRVDRGEVGPGYWAIAFFLNSVGFLFWSGTIPLPPQQYFFFGEVFHVSGFFVLVSGAYRFMGNSYKLWNILVVVIWAIVWGCSIAGLVKASLVAAFFLKALRAVLFIAAGIMILRKRPEDILTGRHLAGWSLIAWGLYILVFAVIRAQEMLNLIFGALVGLQVLAAFGMVAMVVDRMKLRAEKSEKHAKSLEGLLPICCYCKKIRDKNNKWQPLELYIEERSTAEFSHGICPDCLEKYKPDVDR